MSLKEKAAGVLDTPTTAYQKQCTQIIAPAEITGNSDKALATLIAQFALAGHVVHKGVCGDFSVTRWGLCRYCQDLDALHAFATQTGVTS